MRAADARSSGTNRPTTRREVRRKAPPGDGAGGVVERIDFVEAADGVRLALAEVVAAPGLRASRRRGAPAFLLLHGFAQNRRAFTLGPLPAALLRRGARVFLGELRGHGESRIEAGAVWSLASHLELDCPALLDGVRERSGAPRVHLMGHSMGGLLGCALLAGDAPLASLTAWAAPILLGAGRPLVRLASFLAGPFATVAPRGRRVPMDRFLGALAAPLSRPDAGGPVRLLQRVTRLANPAQARPEQLRTLLASADAESPAVLEELARNAVLGRSRVAGVDLPAALRASPVPVAAVVGSRDIFAPRAAVRPVEGEGHAGPRRVIELADASHVDVTLGVQVPRTVHRLWRFLVP